jgi:ubiquinone/menaquinone biosynthesis C-methylase UbiE/uncharacterized protein YbaR (Trm112 family)
MLSLEDISMLACPGCRGGLSFSGETRAGILHQGCLVCAGCAAAWPVRDGLAKLYDEGALSLKERLIRRSYNKYGRYHDALVRFVFPLLKEETAADNRDRYLSRLELLALKPRADGKPIRILEVGVGSGDDIPALRSHLPADLPVEIWGIDVSVGMLRVLRPKLQRPEYNQAKILMADAHALPFPDHAFDRVFHVGAVNSYRDPALALAEMARVAEIGSPIVAVDEWLDHLIFRMLTAYDWKLPQPTSYLPAGASDVRMEQLNPVFYCMTFRSKG